jgi:hypothetical protein
MVAVVLVLEIMETKSLWNFSGLWNQFFHLANPDGNEFMIATPLGRKKNKKPLHDAKALENKFKTVCMLLSSDHKDLFWHYPILAC